jgi:hypothetical protein
MAGIADRADAIRDDLIGKGIRATTDPRQVAVPCVLVVPQEVEFNSMCLGSGRTLWALHILGPGAGGKGSMAVLSELAMRVVKAIPDIERVELDSYSTSDGVPPFPSFKASFYRNEDWV